MIDAGLQKEAAGWFLQRRSGEMTPADRTAFDEWLALHPDAPGAYRLAERMWSATGELADDPELVATRSTEFWRPARRRFAGRWAFGSMAACAILTAALVPGRLRDFADVQLAPFRGGGQMLSTGSARQISRILADGTVVTLDSGTKLRVLEMGARRRIELIAGQAFFKVAKEPLHPFLVTAMNKTVHALGTAFDVRVEPNAVAVTLVEGKVRVDEPRGLLQAPIAAEMTPGKQLVASNDQVWMMTRVDPAAATSWIDDRLIYLPDTIGKIVADVNSGSRRKIVFVGPIDQEQRVVGVFERGDVDTLATVLEVKGIAHVVAQDSNLIEMKGND